MHCQPAPVTGSGGQPTANSQQLFSSYIYLMHNHFFRFKQFTVYQDRCAMKVGTDSVLLGAWTRVDYARRILDIGSGTGLLALMMAQRTEAEITGIDIDPAATEQATENARNTPWATRLQFKNISFQEYVKEGKQESSLQPFDLLISNPPFHPEDIKPGSHQRRLARHSDELSVQEILTLGTAILAPQGRIALVVPAKIYTQVLAEAAGAGLSFLRTLAVKPTSQKPVHRYLLEFGFSSQNNIIEELIIEMNERHDYSPQYRELTRDFYLAF
ncbi:MAG: methyltransferase [Bacteroidales bacterium]